MPTEFQEKIECFVSKKASKSDKNWTNTFVCQDLPIDFENNGESYCVLHFPNKDKHLNSNFNQVLNERKKNKENNFSFIVFSEVAVFSTLEFSQATFESAIFLKDAYFLDTQFGDWNSFNKVQFIGKVSFESAKGGEVKFEECFFFDSVDFNKTQFYLTDFSKSKFESKVIFENSLMNSLFFHETHFGKNSELLFYKSKSNKYLFFKRAIVEGYFSINGANEENCADDKIFMNFENIFVEDPKRVSFRHLSLNPTWFINVDAREFVFTDVIWQGLENSFKKSITKLVTEAGKNNIEKSEILFKISCRQLAENAENNNRFEEASKFRRMAFETEWLEKKEKISNWIKNLVPESEKLKKRFGGSDKEEDKPIPPTNSFGILRRSGDFFIHGLYRITSFYGESWSWALGVLLSLILVIFPIIYTQISFQTCSKDRPIATSLTICESKDEEIRKNCTCSTDQITFTDAIVQSLTTATLQNVEYRKPLTVWGELWIILEKIFAPLQAALLALAIRRKFMR